MAPSIFGFMGTCRRLGAILQNSKFVFDKIIFKLKTYLEEVKMDPFRLPNVEQATKIGITQDITPSVLFPNVCKTKE